MNSLFGDISEQLFQEPELPKTEEWNNLMKLEKEKQVTGIYISGHPLDDYELEMKSFGSKQEIKLGQSAATQMELTIRARL